MIIRGFAYIRCYDELSEGSKNYSRCITVTIPLNSKQEDD